MTAKKIKIAQIGNSRGVRIPADLLRRYQIGESLFMEETPAGILLRPAGGDVKKLSWKDTAREMAASQEDWKSWDQAVGDGLGDLPWEQESRVAEPRTRYGQRSRPRKGR